MNIMKNESGITLVSLVVTIIIMLILATVSIGTVKTGLIEKTKLAKFQAEQTFVKEKIDMALSECEFEFFQSEKGDIKDYIYNNLGKYLTDLNDVEILLESDNIFLTCKYNNNEYSFIVTPNGTSNPGKKLFGNVKVGEFINYPKSYEDAICGTEYNSNNGWVIIDDGIMENTSGKIKIMSYGIPGKWVCQSNDEENINNFINNFRNEKMYIYDVTKSDVGNMLVEGISMEISPLSLKEMNAAYNKLYNTNRAENEETGEITNGNDMFCNQLSNMYWLIDGKRLLIVATNKIIYNESITNIRNGVKIVITLNPNLTGNYEDGLWKINN